MKSHNYVHVGWLSVKGADKRIQSYVFFGQADTPLLPPLFGQLFVIMGAFGLRL